MSDNVTEMRDHFVYRTYDADGRLLYIGCTKRLTSRWKMHKQERPEMVAATATCRVQGPYAKSVARTIERDAIRTEDPAHNYCAPSNIRRRTWIKSRTADLEAVDIPSQIAWRQAHHEADMLDAQAARS